MFNFVWTNHVLEVVIVLLSFEWKLNKTQIRQRIFNCTDMQIMYFILDKILKLLTYYTPFYH